MIVIYFKKGHTLKLRTTHMQITVTGILKDSLHDGNVISYNEKIFSNSFTIMSLHM